MNPTQLATSINVLDLLVDAVCVVDVEGRFQFVSAAFERIFGYAPDEVIGRRMIELVHPDDRERTLQAVANIMAGKLQLHFENRYVRKDGKTAHIVWSARWSPGDGLRVAVARDVTERKRIDSMQAAIYAISEAAYAAEDLPALFRRIHEIIGSLLPAANFAVALYDVQRDLLSFPYHVDERQGAPLPCALAEHSRCAEVIRTRQTLLLTPDSLHLQASQASQATQDDGPLYWLGVPLHAQRGTIGALVLQGYSEELRYTEEDKELLQFVSTQVAAAIERSQMHERLRHMAQYDQLTQLPNRQLFNERLKVALTHARRDKTLLALLFIDLDRFKLVNDTLGHAVGDLLLQGVAARLRSYVRASDTVARLGGDEFVLLLENDHPPGHAVHCAQKILAAFEQPFDLAGHTLHIRPSIGMALYPDHGEDGDRLLEHADQAMYWSKKNGGNRFGMQTVQPPS